MSASDERARRSRRAREVAEVCARERAVKRCPTCHLAPGPDGPLHAHGCVESGIPPDVSELCERSADACVCGLLMKARDLGEGRGVIRATNVLVDRLNSGDYAVEGGGALAQVRADLVDLLKGLE